MTAVRKLCEYSAYNFLAGLYRLEQFSDVDAFVAAKESDLLVKRAIPTFWYVVYDIDSKKVIATLWFANSEFEFLKIGLDGTVLEHYRRNFTGNSEFISLDVKTGERLEVYRFDKDRLAKYHPETNELLGFTQGGSFDKMPDAFKSKLVDFPHKNSLEYWAEKPYGNVIGVRYWLENV